MTEVILAILILLPPLLAYFLKSNAALAFLALCGGFSVITLSGSDIEHLVGQTKITSLTSNDIDLTLLVLPLLFTLLLTYKSVFAKAQRYFQFVPAVCAGALLAIVAAPMIGDTLQTDISSSGFWHDLQNLQSYIIGVGFLFSLLIIWTSKHQHPGSGKKHKKD